MMPQGSPLFTVHGACQAILARVDLPVSSRPTSELWHETMYPFAGQSGALVLFQERLFLTQNRHHAKYFA